VAGLAGRLQFSELNLPIPQVPAIVVGVVDDDQGEYRRHIDLTDLLYQVEC
jgi:hypothetical protein